MEYDCVINLGVLLGEANTRVFRWVENKKIRDFSSRTGFARTHSCTVRWSSILRLVSLARLEAL